MNDRLRRCEALIPRIDQHGARLRGLSDAELRQARVSLRTALADGMSMDSVVPEAFALTSEACRRVTGEAPVATQVVAGAALHLGMVTDVKDGEGKDLILLLAAILSSLSGQSVHVMSVNNHLARQAAAWADPITRLLGMSTGLLTSGMPNDVRQDAHHAAITYGRINEFAYDYLRANLSRSADEHMWRGHDCAFIYDIDSLLIDECRTPYVISASDPAGSRWPHECARIALMLHPGLHYRIDPVTRRVSLTDAGAGMVEDQLGSDDALDPGFGVIHEIRTALLAKDTFRRGRDYDVIDDRIVSIDETGMRSNRRIGDRIHRALEAKECVPVSTRRQILARITTRGYVGLYRRVAGVSGSAARVAEPLRLLYGLDTVEIPTRRPVVRLDRDDRLFRDDGDRNDAVLAAVLRSRAARQPVIVGAATAHAADQIRRLLADAGITCQVADGQDHEHDRNVLAAAGHPGAVTIAMVNACRSDETVLDGLAVFGVGRHASRRHDDRIQGLAGRRGTPGECAYFVSCDDLDALWNTHTGADERATLFPESVSDHGHPLLTDELERMQEEHESYALKHRKIACEYDEVLENQCRECYRQRRQVFDEDNLETRFLELLHSEVDEVIADYNLAGAADGRPQVIAALAALGGFYPTKLTRRQLRKQLGDSTIVDHLRDDATRAYRERCAEVARITPSEQRTVPALQAQALLAVHDKWWRRHLANMELLRDDIWTRTPLGEAEISEFQREAAILFRNTQRGIRKEAVASFFNLAIT